MPEPIPPVEATPPKVDAPQVDAPVVPDVKPEPEKDAEAKGFKFNRNKPMNSQVDSLLKTLPEDPKKEDKKDDEDKPLADKGEAKPPGAKLPTPEEAKFKEDEPTPETVELPPVAKYILDNLPSISVLGHEGENKDKTYNVKRIEDLPDDFEFASRRAELVFNAAVAAQEMNARELLGKYRQTEQQNLYQELQTQEAVDVESDVKQLQKEGILGAFPDSSDPKFNDDPAVKEANEIYEIFKKVNEEYAKAKRTYRISYRDAADKYYLVQSRNKPTEPPVVDKPKEPDKKDEPKVNEERQEIAKKVSAPSSTTPEKGVPRMPRGSTMQDVLRLYRTGRI